MSQYLSQIPSQQMRQEQRLTPQLIQSMNILQLNVAALEQHLQAEMEKNPLLEYEPGDESQDSAPAETEEVDRPNDKLDVLEWLDNQYDYDSIDRPQLSHRNHEDRDAKMDAMANTACRPANLYEYLMEQWGLLDLNPETVRAGEALINHLDEDGFLRTPLEVVADSVRPVLSVATLVEALPKIQELDPPGIGATSLQECLRLQLQAIPGGNKLEQTILQNHYDDLLKNRLPQIAKSLGVDIEEVKAAVHVISRLTPTPGLSVVNRDVPQIKPDVIVEYADDGRGYQIRLTQGNEPRLRISKRYLQMLKDRRVGKVERDYLKTQQESATALIDAIQFRRSRLLEVAEAVVEKQQDYFDLGPQTMKVLRMSDLANQLHCDPSTISRTVADKYVQCPRGIVPLRDFFVGGTESSNGESTSWDSVKAQVADLIGKEDKSSPLSDDQVAAMMNREGITLSRRTVAKYRQQLNIPTARQRRLY